MSSIPFSETASRGVTCSIPIKRRHRAAAASLVAEIQLAIADGELQGLLGGDSTRH